MTNKPPRTELQEKIITEVEFNQKGVCLFLTMGGGKTRVALELLEKFKAKRVLVLSLATIIKDVWPAENLKWLDNKYSYVNLANTGSEKIMSSLQQGFAENTIVGINYDIFSSNSVMKTKPKVIDLENSPILNTLVYMPWDVVILDESTKIKDPTSKVALSVLNLAFNLPNAFIMSLSGTPNPETNLDIYTQVSVVDRGQRLGDNFHAFRNRYFMKPPYSYRWIPQHFTEGLIAELIKDITYIMTKEEMETKLPPLLFSPIYFDLSEKERDAYKQMVEAVITMPDKMITAKNAGIVTNKLAQLSSGFVYDNEGEPQIFGYSKALATVKSLLNLPGKAMLVYFYTASYEAIIHELNTHNITWIDATDTNPAEFEKAKYKVLLVQPKSNAYGGNWQHALNYLLLYDLELSGERFEQLIKRLHRPGQEEITWIMPLLANKTQDEKMLRKVKQKDLNAVEFLKEIKGLQAK